MVIFLSMLRGINVSGQKKILMADLKALYENLGFRDVSTYIQSGNVIFAAQEKKADVLREKISKGIFAKYKFEVPVLIRSLGEMEAAIAGNPFLKEKGIDLERLHLTFLEEEPAAENLAKLKDVNYQPDRFIISGKNIYMHCPVSYGNSKLSNNFFESKLKVTATTRNWKSVNVLTGMMKGEK